jgi:serine/threonine protein kinase
MSWALGAGDVLAHYRVVSPLGSGGMAQVYLAEDVRLGRRLALKILSPRGARDDERLQRFQREARAVSALNCRGLPAVLAGPLLPEHPDR